MAMQVGYSQTLPQLGKDPIEKVVAAMTAEEKVSLLVGTGMPGFGGQSAVVGSTQNIVPGAAGTTFPIERLGMPCNNRSPRSPRESGRYVIRRDRRPLR